MQDRTNIINQINDSLGNGGSWELAEQVYDKLRADGRISYTDYAGLVLAEGVDLMAVAAEVLSRAYGTIPTEFGELTLVYRAEATNQGADGEVTSYTARALDANGARYLVSWATSEAWNRMFAIHREALDAGDGLMAPARARAMDEVCKEHGEDSFAYVDAFLSDESNACDWSVIESVSRLS